MYHRLFEGVMTLFPLYLAICAVPAAAGLLFQPGVWYRDLDKPTWTPPDKLFPVIWAVLYVLMSLAAARVATQPDSALALGLWSLQITVSTLWSAVFFGLHRIRTGAAIIAILWAAVLATTLVFLDHDVAAALMMLPYLAWGSFALALNVSVMRRNPSMDTT
jgi:tryptophan-rich sensory protein